MLHTILPESKAPPFAAEDVISVVPGSLTSGILLLCDHAENTLPPEYGTLGLPPEQLERHIAYDPGAAGITRHMARLLNAPAVFTHYSRLLIDPNRGEDDPTLIMRISDGAVVPGNVKITDAERQKRIERFYKPYHEAIARTIDAMIAAGKTPVIFSIHSFTENWRGWPRPWQVGVLWDRDPRLAVPMIDALRRDPALTVGDNEPYAGSLPGDCINKHATLRGLANALIEVRQDLIRDDAGQKEWAETLASHLRMILSRRDAELTFHRAQSYGSHSDAKGPGGSNGMEKQMTQADIDPKLTMELQAAVYRRLVSHLRNRSDVQNIDLMNLAGFCRNCLSNWYQEAASEKGVDLSKDQAREIVYGMPYETWKAEHQSEATPEQQVRFKKASGH
jgi:predicted N-formylglutamate amidohydrolase